MLEATLHEGQLLTLLIMALALGMDAFSLGVGIGMRGIRLLDILKLSAVIGLFHVLMPLVGIAAGQYMSLLLGHVATLVAGLLLLLLGGHMLFVSLRGGEELGPSFADHRTTGGLLLFALSVSVDSFSVGISLGMFAADALLTILLFGLAGGLMSVLGLLAGRRIGRSLGSYGEAAGGAILMTFGILFLL
ncbi:manganese efflux pump [Paenibacillus sp. FSL W8-1187]|uniref:Putative manganese efflux pump MntP n=1 Tax=Paenibacillus pasadenensis TaxID=217090 RepID=A0A2N5NDE4_9BACL|nr:MULTISPECIES: manganese efflux pump [Paenibacillus]PLT48365.1 putative transmembrane protein ywlD [Paenibacillus pasadenensis]QGG58156.1 manganese efflux pump [Paenibacillus sp. B01]